MRILDHHATLALLPFEPLTEAVESVLEAACTSRAHCPVRIAVPLPDGDVQGGTLLAMPAADAQFAVVKTVTVHPSNPARGLPAIGAQVLLMDATTGERLALLDGEAVTSQRTAAVSIVAIRRLLRLKHWPEAKVLIIGSGAQAHVHALALAQCLGVQHITIASRQLLHSQRLADQIQTSTTVQTTAIDLADEAALNNQLARSQILVTATSSSTPVITNAQQAKIEPNTVICAVGAFKSTMAEVPAQLVERSILCVDTISGCRAEAGDLLQAKINWSQVTALQDAAAVHRLDQPIIFKSVGSALWDLAAARCAWAQLSS